MRVKIIYILIISIPVQLFAQTIVRPENYMDYKFGIYQTKSLDNKLMGQNSKLARPFRKFSKNENLAFLKISEPVGLFDQINDKGLREAVSFLNKSSIIELDTIFYQEIYRDTTQEWFLTFNVWYAIRLDGRKFYTDFKIHDKVAYKNYLDEFEQTFLLIAQSTGYDDYYDSGYPNNFYVIVLDRNNEIIYESDILEFDFGDEFWESSYVQIDQNYTQGFKFTISGYQDEFTGTWTGTELIK